MAHHRFPYVGQTHRHILKCPQRQISGFSCYGTTLPEHRRCWFLKRRGFGLVTGWKRCLDSERTDVTQAGVGFLPVFSTITFWSYGVALITPDPFFLPFHIQMQSQPHSDPHPPSRHLPTSDLATFLLLTLILTFPKPIGLWTFRKQRVFFLLNTVKDFIYFIPAYRLSFSRTILRIVIYVLYVFIY